MLAAATSLDRNLNGCGYCKNAACTPSGDCTIDSPATDEKYTPNPGTPNWDYRQVYEVWIDMAAFSGLGFGQAYITYMHSSPAKSNDTITVEPSPCPPEWDKPYCPPSVTQEGGNCFGRRPRRRRRLSAESADLHHQRGSHDLHADSLRRLPEPRAVPAGLRARRCERGTILRPRLIAQLRKS